MQCTAQLVPLLPTPSVPALPHPSHKYPLTSSNFVVIFLVFRLFLFVIACINRTHWPHPVRRRVFGGDAESLYNEWADAATTSDAPGEFLGA